ncbi:putative bifunctional diguanylate cyclase/phosphodiesterase [Parerythrobacter jejuensis]|uniref:EAL domain-containing protein n=1 Tax=Parerythrobacter jejuensis TaxID=795812 RepID=A0A845ASF0_9SPHN|nr:GGDEF and EAL domain-containing protein [Parerythrobacter jejuensis]MXP31771.1 EAL domain-containing protein [Parerythrobacter jejuensis]
MSENRSHTLTLPERLPLLAVLGLKDTEGTDWPRLRALQYARVGRSSFARVGTHSVIAGLAFWISWGQVGAIALLAWLAALGCAASVFARQDHKLGKAAASTLSRKDAKHHAKGALAIGLVWSALLLFVAVTGQPGALETLWMIAMLVPVGSAIFLGSAPLSATVIILTTGSTAAGLFAWTGNVEAAGSVTILTALLLYGVMTRAEAFLRACVAEGGMAEKNEVVSLLLREFEENEADWLWQIDTNRRIRSASPRFAFAFGVEPEEIEGMPFLQLISGPAWDTGQFPTSLHDLAERLKRRENFSNLLVKVTLGSEHRWWELSGTPMLDQKGRHVGFRGVGSDVTEQRESSEKIAYLARYDTLTGLPNRLMLNEALGEAMRYARQWRSRSAFLMIDLDRFKAVNDSLGHLVGDRLLAQVSNRLKEILTENEMCGRLGGDEFAIVIRDASDAGTVSTVAKRIIDRLSQPYEVDNHTLYVGASVGSAVAPRDGNSVEELMRNADLALYRSKDLGGGEHCEYEPSLHASAEERRQLEFSLRKALERDEMVLNFQPVVDAHREEIVSFEALLRWQSKDHGFVSPAKFIPLAEETRLIVPIGTWVLQQACIEAARWPSHIKVNINVSPEQLIEPDFAPTVVRALAQSGLEASRLEIEVTESIFMRDAQVAGAALEEVMALGCQVALDDFGTGYSSLGYLRKLRFSTIKVDRSFVQGAAQGSNESLAIIRAVVAMAESLEMSTTAEGVETSEEAAMIRSLGCNKIQGYYFGRPMTDVDARKLVEPKLPGTQISL